MRMVAKLLRNSWMRCEEGICKDRGVRSVTLKRWVLLSECTSRRADA